MDLQPTRRYTSFVAVLLLLIPSAIAQYSIKATFDTGHLVTLNGVITQVQWMNPLTYLYVSVKDSDGNSIPWSIRLSGAHDLALQGFGKDSFAKGSHVVVEAWLAKDADEVIADLKDPSRTAVPGREPLAAAWKLTLDDGRVLPEASRPSAPWPPEPELFPSQR